MKNYITKNLGDIGKVSMCKRILKSQTSEKGEIPFYKISTFGNKADCFISREIYEEYKEKYSFPKKGDILLSAAGTLGRTVIYGGEDAFFQDSNIVWIDNDESILINDYLYYFYMTKPWRKTTGSTIERLYNDNIREIKITFPESIESQKKIIHILKSIDRKIANNNAISTELESMAKTIYDYWFLQFEFPDENGKPYKSSGGKMVWNEGLKREIPEGWEVSYLKDLCLFSNGINYDKDEIGDKKYKIVNVRNITASSLVLDDSDFDTISLKQNKSDRYIIGNNDILIARSGTPGATRLLMNNDGNTIFCGFIIKCTPKNDNFKYFLTYELKKLEGSSATKTGGSILQNVSQDTLNKILLCVPNQNIINMFNEHISNILEKINLSVKENQELAELRDFLLPLLMNGQVGFKETK